jgi:hypothetical protein
MPTTNANIRSGANSVVIAGSAKGTWVTANTDATATAQTTAQLYAPSSIAGTSKVQWIKVHAGCTRVLVRARMPKNTSAVATSPVIRVYGANMADGALIASDGTVPTDGTIQFLRLDNASVTAAGPTVTLTCATTTTMNDATYWYSNVVDLTGYDLLGSDYVGVLVSTSASITGGGAVEVQLLLLN